MSFLLETSSILLFLLWSLRPAPVPRELTPLEIKRNEEWERILRGGNNGS